MVLGSPGLGKTRLLDELDRRVRDRATVLTGRCDAGGLATFAPIAEALRAATGIGDAVPPDVVRQGIAALVPDDEPEHDRIVDRAAGLLGAGAPASPEETFWAVRRLLAGLARARPVVLVLDDLHWAEPLLLDLVEHVVEWSADVPAARRRRGPTGAARAAAVTGVARRRCRPRRAGRARRGRCHPVGGRRARRRRASRRGRGPCAGGERGQPAVRARAGAHARRGRRAAPRRGAVAGRRGARRGGDAADDPRAARVARSSGSARRSVRSSSGPPSSGASSRAARSTTSSRRSSGASSTSHLDALQRSELVEPDDSWYLGEPVVRFHHALIRDAAYRRLLKGTRAELHEDYADWLGDRLDAGAPDRDDTLGWHLEQAHASRVELEQDDEHVRALGRRAADHLARAGHNALDARRPHGRCGTARAGARPARRRRSGSRRPAARTVRSPARGGRGRGRAPCRRHAGRGRGRRPEADGVAHRVRRPARGAHRAGASSGHRRVDRARGGGHAGRRRREWRGEGALRACAGVVPTGAGGCGRDRPGPRARGCPRRRRPAPRERRAVGCAARRTVGPEPGDPCQRALPRCRARAPHHRRGTRRRGCRARGARRCSRRCGAASTPPGG